MALSPVKQSGTAVTTGEVRLSYPHLITPQQPSEDNPNGKPRYNVTILIPKSDTETVAALRAAIEAAKEEGKHKVFGGKVPSALHVTLRDGDAEEEADMVEKNPSYKGHYFMSTGTTSKPVLVDASRLPVTDEGELYAGCYAQVALKAGAYSGKKKGITFYLNGVMKTRDGEPLGAGKVDAVTLFGAPEEAADLF